MTTLEIVQPTDNSQTTHCELKQKWRAGLSHRISRIEVEEAPKTEVQSVPQWKRKQEQEKKAEESERKVEPLWKRIREAEKKQESERKPEQPDNKMAKKQNETQPDMERRRPEPLWKKKQEPQKLEPKVEPERKPEVTKNNEMKNNVHHDKKLEIPKTGEVKKIEPVRKLEPLWKRKFEPVSKPEPEVKEVPAKKIEPIWKRKIEPQEKKEPETKQEPAKKLEPKIPAKLEPTWKRKIVVDDKTELKTKPEPLTKQEPKPPGKVEPIWKRKIVVDDKIEPKNKQEPVKKPEPLWKRKKEPEKEPEQKSEPSKKQASDEKTRKDPSSIEDLPEEDETEEIICPMCSELYDEEEYQPVLLPRCGHTFCRPCLTTIKGKGHFPCPTCRKRHLKPAIEDLPVHNEVLNKANAYREEKAGRCQTHQNLLVYWCYDCQEPLCSSCRVMNGHEVVRTRVVLQEKRQEMKESGKTILDSVLEERKKIINSVRSCSLQLLKACEESAAVEGSSKGVKEMLSDTRQTADLSFVFTSLERMKSILGVFRKASSDSESDEDMTPKLRRRRERRQTQQDGEADTNEDANSPEKKGTLTHAENKKQERDVIGSTNVNKTKEMRIGQQQPAAAGMQGVVPAEVLSQGPLLSLGDASLWPLTCCLPVIQSVIPQDSPEVFLEVAVGERHLGRIYIKLWGHLRRAHNFLALCMGTHGPSYRGAKFDEVFSRGLKGECLHAGPYPTPSGELSAHRVMDALEWDGEFKGIQRKGLVVGAGSGRPDRDACFDICTIENPSRHFACPFGEVVDGWPTITAILEYRPLRAVTMVDVGVVVPDGALPVS
ncbi:Tripartite motif-containing protein 72 [Portunus trituberculatus]|uniref:Tripartite motif-containing protein 72 n=1 Tax=Portunus trituberculatus TaxID=210409 RepID=A0A5B7CIA0_PORTR|nr:Tripartite motif-containing protein 72 [Portunus trituberculatus]